MAGVAGKTCLSSISRYLFLSFRHPWVVCLGSALIPSRQINAAAEVIYSEVDPTANIIFGALVDERMEGRMSITVLATGFQTKVRECCIESLALFSPGSSSCFVSSGAI